MRITVEGEDHEVEEFVRLMTEWKQSNEKTQQLLLRVLDVFEQQKVSQLSQEG